MSAIPQHAFLPPLVLATLAVVTIPMTSGCVKQPVELPQTAAFSMQTSGEQLPEYDVLRLDGGIERIGGTQPVTLLNLWATWCAPCRAEFPDLEALHRELKEDGLRVVAVDIDAEPVPVLENVAADLGLTLTIARDTAGLIQETYPALGVPTSFLISADGSLVRTWTGVIPTDDYDVIRQHVTSRKKSHN